MPTPWLQLNFIYGNSTVSATAILAGTSAIDAAGYYNPVDQLGVNDAFITLNLTKQVGFPLQLNVGAYTGRYGAMGTYDAGRYGTPLIARTNTIGETITAGLQGSASSCCVLEQGLGGQLGRPPVGLVPAGWNDFADRQRRRDLRQPAARRRRLPSGSAALGLHYLTAWTQDDLTARRQHPGRTHHRAWAPTLNITAGAPVTCTSAWPGPGPRTRRRSRARSRS